MLSQGHHIISNGNIFLGDKMKDKSLLFKSIHASLKAGDAILEIYDSDFSVEKKADDSPLTLADKRSHEIIEASLTEFNIPILSEEGKNIDYSVRQDWEQLWIVDPLDGTKEFVKRNGEFTVNIALVEHGKPVLGVIFVPVKNVLYFSERDLGSYKLSDSGCIEELKKQLLSGKKDILFEKLMAHSEQLPIKRSTGSSCTIIGSRSHATKELDAYVKEKELEYDVVDFISAGSSLKFCLVAEGRADVYPRLGPTMEWDTAAGQAIAENAGAGVLVQNTKTPLVYNKADLLNPYFIVQY